ncbi:nodulation protein NfeD [bacterium]|nr:nodulation protein NfeD [bacterium]
MKKILFLILLVTLLVSPQKLFSKENVGYILNVDSSIGPITYYQIKSVIRLAEKNRADFIILVIDTPGGLLSSTRKIVQEILSSEVPVISYISPRGAQCASAGVFIALSSHIIAMSPATNIGAAHPVSLTSNSDETVNTKLVNDTVSFIKSIAVHRKRNPEWAEKAVRESISSTEIEVLKENVIDVISQDIFQLTSEIDGKKIIINERETILNTKNPKIIPYKESFKEDVLKVIAHPNIAYILLMIGFAGILLEFYNPGFGVPGIVGTISLILAFFALHALPINIAGIFLIVASLIFFAIEAVTASFGLFIISGIVSLFLGSMLLFKPTADVNIPYFLIFTISFFVSLMLFLSLFFIIRTKKKKVTTGKEGMIGEKGKTLTALSPEGTVFVHGEYWTGISNEEEIPADTEVEVIDITNFKLTVKRTERKG